MCLQRDINEKDAIHLVVEGAVASALDSGASARDSSPSRGHVLRSWERHFAFTAPLSTQVYYRRIYCWGQPCDGLTSHPEGSILRVASYYGNRDKLRPDEPLGS